MFEKPSRQLLEETLNRFLYFCCLLWAYQYRNKIVMVTSFKKLVCFSSFENVPFFSDLDIIIYPDPVI